MNISLCFSFCFFPQLVCQSLKVSNCFQLASKYTMETVLADSVCKVQCAFAFRAYPQFESSLPLDNRLGFSQHERSWVVETQRIINYGLNLKAYDFSSSAEGKDWEVKTNTEGLSLFSENVFVWKSSCHYKVVPVCKILGSSCREMNPKTPSNFLEFFWIYFFKKSNLFCSLIHLTRTQFILVLPTR